MNTWEKCSRPGKRVRVFSLLMFKSLQLYMFYKKTLKKNWYDFKTHINFYPPTLKWQIGELPNMPLNCHVFVT